MLSWLLSLGVALVPVSGEAIAPLLPTPAEVPLAQTLPTVSDDLDLGKQLLEELLGCVRQTTLELSQPSITQLEAASTQCVLDVILLGENGRVRPDASDRLVALMQTMGVRLPQPVSKGQATIPLQRLSESEVFTLPVTVAGKPRQFLLDTGASNSILSSQVAQEAGLQGTSLSSSFLAYFVVGDDCSNVNPAIHQLPPLAIQQANVSGLMGMELPQTAIPGNLSGVLGLDFLSGFEAIVDPSIPQLQLSTPTSTPRGIPLYGRMGVMTARVMVNDRGPYLFVLDTGAEWSVMSERLAARLSLSDPTTTQEVEVLGFCGTERGKQIHLNSLSIEGYEVRDLEAVVISNELLDLIGVDGIVGQNFLNRYRQRWQFGARGPLGFPEVGNLELIPLEGQ